jgi:dynein heavy chain
LIPSGKIDIDDEGFTLQSLIDLDVNQYQDEIVAISRRATGEAKLKTDLTKLDEAWKSLRLVVVQYKDRDQVFVLEGKGMEDLYAFLDENLANINMIRGNQYKAVVEKEAETLRK